MLKPRSVLKLPQTVGMRVLLPYLTIVRIYFYALRIICNTYTRKPAFTCYIKYLKYSG